MDYFDDDRKKDFGLKKYSDIDELVIKINSLKNEVLKIKNINV